MNEISFQFAGLQSKFIVLYQFSASQIMEVGPDSGWTERKAMKKKENKREGLA